MGKLSDFKSKKWCSVPQCTSRCTNEVSLFCFPKDETLRKTWVDAIRIEKPITSYMQVCSRHFVKNDFIVLGANNRRRLKKSVVPSQNLPWQFPNKRVSPALAKARMERLKKRIQLKTSSTPDGKTDAGANSAAKTIIRTSPKNDEISDDESADNAEKLLKSNQFKKQVRNTDSKESQNKIANKNGGNITEKIHNKATEAKKDENNMRSRAPKRLKRKSVLKCKLCGRKCLTPQALRTHQLISHKNAKSDYNSPEKKSPAMSMTKKPVAALISVKQPEQLISPKLLAKVNKNEQLVEQVIRDFDGEGAGTETDYSSDASVKKEQLKPAKRDRRKTEFECPKCKKRFAVYFSALKHIQKHHSAARQGDKMRAANLLKPKRIETCTICSLTLSSDIHYCAGPLKLAAAFVCTGCTQEFKTLTLFDMHKSGMHSEGVESMFFPTLDEFENWKAKMEVQTEVKFTVLDQNDTKKIYRCAHVTSTGAGNGSRAHMCPSSIIVQEFAKGFQVHYYPNHYGHATKAYTLSNAFKNYSIASLMNVTVGQLPNESDEDASEPDLYLQFKQLIELLVNEAARINVNGLKKLMRKALEMSAIVNSYVEDEDDDMTSTLSLSIDSDDLQEQIRKALQSFKMSEKRKVSIDVPETPAKKSKPVFQSTENTLKERSPAVKKPNTSVIKMKEGIENLKRDTKKVTINTQKINQSPSFISSYQEFVGQTMVKSVEKKTTAKSAGRNKRETDAKRKPIVKTKMGQFKPSPPKKMRGTPEPKSPSRNSITSVKDIKYEVKEQENDCNILILKI